MILTAVLPSLTLAVEHGGRLQRIPLTQFYPAIEMLIVITDYTLTYLLCS